MQRKNLPLIVLEREPETELSPLIEAMCDNHGHVPESLLDMASNSAKWSEGKNGQVILDYKGWCVTFEREPAPYDKNKWIRTIDTGTVSFEYFSGDKEVGYLTKEIALDASAEMNEEEGYGLCACGKFGICQPVRLERK